MSDIVERLRVMAQYLPEQRSIFREAASEIERLTKDYENLRLEYARVTCCSASLTSTENNRG